MGILEAYRGQEENLQQQPKAGKRIVENVGKVQIPAQDRLARNIELDEGPRRDVVVRASPDRQRQSFQSELHSAGKSTFKKQFVCFEETYPEEAELVRNHASTVHIILNSNEAGYGCSSCSATPRKTE